MTSLTAWAQARPLNNKNQRELLVWLAESADEEGTARVTKAQMIASVPDINTTGQADRALRGLLDAALITQGWDMSTYTHIYTLRGAR